MSIWHRHHAGSLTSAAAGHCPDTSASASPRSARTFCARPCRCTAHTHQPIGVLHGGASVALAETVGSLAATLCVDPELYVCLGQEINANHLRSVSHRHGDRHRSPVPPRAAAAMSGPSRSAMSSEQAGVRLAPDHGDRRTSARRHDNREVSAMNEPVPAADRRTRPMWMSRWSPTRTSSTRCTRSRC